MITLRKFTAAALLAVLLATTGFAWDDTGHQLSAMIAWETMSPVSRERAFRILLAAPEDSDLSVPYNAFSARPEDVKRLELFMYAGTWPDVVRNRAFENRYRKYHKSNWHYGAIFWKGGGEVLEDFPEPSGIAVEKLADFETALRSAETPDSEKAMALAWFLHVAADLHNPLHNASRVTETEPKGDQGGNLFYLEPPKEDRSWRLNLHSYWDSQISRNLPREGAASDTDYLRPISTLALAMYPASHFGDFLRVSQYAEWNREGFALLPIGVYGTLERDRLPDEKYSNRTFRLAFEQIALAGLRMGMTLNSIFDPEQTAVGMFRRAPECRVIRTIPYPVSKKPTGDQRPTIALLDLCPSDRGMVARPTITLDDEGSSAGYEYDVLMVFEDSATAWEYARKNVMLNVKID